ncbi:ABC transporter ATP-binding protein [Candidatus Acetothermia bacterium]|jgi:branched-chain amino acid transport system ATP-binding protein|nr:ABC transporter ATP-binding protein [Candidatus Acetothermia bacterium]MCI2431680.1 ABC transporter ATP-binding protein [Candidatus Acetothermia bacterium]MCI2436396.1 ABC transporter ATP-binding protein [Candidatus Acetothermia bacterium]
MPGEILLEVRDLVKDFGGLRAVNKCSLSVQRGTITGLIGPNGAGKTTLFNLVTGFHRPDSGQVFFRGEEITGLAPYRVFHKKLCRTFQIPREFKQMTVLENLMLVPAGQRGENLLYPWFLPKIVRRQEQEIREKALSVLEFVNLIHLEDEYAGNLSGGQKKLLELARTLMADPEMVLLDEPGAGVNPTLMKQLVANIEKLCYERGVTFLLIEHDMDLVMSLCSPVIVMSNGEKLAEGSPQEIQHNERVLEAYLGSQYRRAVVQE